MISVVQQTRTKTVPATELKNRFGAIITDVQSGEVDAVIVENRGAPTVAIVNVSELPAMQERKEQERQKAALEQLRQARAAVQKRLSRKLTDQEALELTKEFSDEVLAGIVQEGGLTFERDGS
jgi:prevent-host-death family protein